jgi:hypothetical protein
MKMINLQNTFVFVVPSQFKMFWSAPASRRILQQQYEQDFAAKCKAVSPLPF